MLTYIVRRVLYSIPVLVFASVITFFGITSVGDPLGTLRTQPGISQQTIQNIIERKHLDQPVHVRYGYWVRDSVTDKFGTTLFGSRPIWPQLKRAFMHTLQLVIAAEAIALVLAILLGVLSARYQYSFFDHTTTTVSFLGFSIPIFWFALMLQVAMVNILEATGMRLFYVAGLSSPGISSADGFFVFWLDRARHLALPIIALSYVSVAQYSRYMRSSMLDVLNQDYVRTARAKGLTERKVTMKHALRNALIPVVTVAALNIGAVFGGVIITETVFSLDGMGLFFLRALAARDAYSLMAWMMLTAVLIILFNLIADILYGYLDPRIRYD